MHIHNPYTPTTRYESADERSAPRSKSQPKTTGHDTVLRALQSKGSMTTIIFAGGDDTMTGTIAAFDKYTITIRDGAERHILYKHDIRSITGKETPQVPK